MNTSILQKIVDELKKTEPNLQYVIGVLETLIELNPTNEVYKQPEPSMVKRGIATNLTDESTTEEIPAFLKPGPLGRIIG